MQEYTIFCRCFQYLPEFGNFEITALPSRKEKLKPKVSNNYWVLLTHKDVEKDRRIGSK
jgi:hypothetical protein